MLELSGGTINMPAVLVANGLGAWLMCILLLEKRHYIYDARQEIRTFHTMCSLCLILCVVETIGFYLDGKQFPYARLIYLAFSVSLFIMDAIFSYIWLSYIAHKLFSEHYLLRWVKVWGKLPAICVCVLGIANLFTDVFFGISSENVYYRAPLAFIVYFVTYFYLISGAVLAIYYSKKISRTYHMPVGTFLLPVFVGSVLQYCFYGIALVWPSVAVGLTALHITLQNEESTRDLLTGVYNRNYLIHYWNYAFRRSRRGASIAGMLLDINNFKYINDTYGHNVGDQVLHAVGGILKKAVGPNAIVARYGGDEFVILTEDSSPEELLATREKIDIELEKYSASGQAPCRISLSMGIAELQNTELNDLFNQMDTKMYREKHRYYQQNDVVCVPSFRKECYEDEKKQPSSASQ